MRRGLPAALLPLMLALPATALFLAAPWPAQAEELGRLFYTPQQRLDMDRRRANNAQTAAAAATPAPVVDLITVNGQISRSSGKSTTWINGVPQNDMHKGPDPSRIAIPATEEAGSASLKVGETLDRLKGERRDGLEGGRVSVRSPPR